MTCPRLLRLVALSLLIGAAVGACGDRITVVSGSEACMAASVCDDLCVDTRVDPLHCGACGAVCGTSERCIDGACTVACANGLTLCGDGCVDTHHDRENCGECGLGCPTGEVCASGACATECVGGAVACGSACVDTSADPTHCGGCDIVCDDGLVCDHGLCALTCVGGTTDCLGSCVDTNVDPDHCGGCGAACEPGEVCSLGQCDLACAGGTSECSDVCVDTVIDPSHCGGCDLACGAGEICSGGQCGPACDGATTACNGSCVDLMANAAHCGVCDNACALAAEACVGGTCLPLASACQSIGPLATASHNGGGTGSLYGPHRAIDGHNESQCGGYHWAWVTNDSAALGDWFQLEWPNPQVIGSIYIDGANALAPTCDTPDMGRDIAAADIQYWDGLQWVTVASIAGAENYAVSLPAPVTTTAIRLYDIQTSGNDYGLNSVIYELYVFHAQSCPAPPGT